jgi:hypothetical protein
MVYRMSSEEYVDPSGNTEQFRVFVQRADAVPEKPASSRYLMLGIIVAIIVVAAVVAILAV